MKNGPYPYYDIISYETLYELLLMAKNEYASKTLFKTKLRRELITVTYNQFYDDVGKLSAYFHNAFGVKNRIAIVGENSYSWILTYFATVCSGNVIVPIDKDLSSRDIKLQVDECDIGMFIYSDDYKDISENLRETMTSCRFISMSELRSIISTIHKGFYAKTDPDDLAVIIHTSSTTGMSKGVMLSQRNICTDSVFSCRAIRGHGRTMAILPLHHAFAMISSVLGSIYYGVELIICPSLKTLDALMKEFKPTYLFLVPQIVYAIDKRISQRISDSGHQKRVAQLLAISKILRTIGIDMRKVFFKQILDSLGGEIEFIVSGGAPIDQTIIDRLNSYGILILNGYGITECSPVVSVNRQYHFRSGSVGQPMSEVQVIIDNPDKNGVGEICVKGDIVMLGYYNNPAETRAVLNNGFFHTGDIGWLDRDGFLYIKGRIKNLIILSNGKNVSSEELEACLLHMNGVEEVIVSESDQKLIAEIYPNKEFASTIPNLVSYFRKEIDIFNATLPPYKAIADFILRTEPFEKTTTKKIKRSYK